MVRHEKNIKIEQTVGIKNKYESLSDTHKIREIRNLQEVFEN